MSKATLILAEAEAVENKSAALTAIIRKDNYSLRITDGEMWSNCLSLRNTYDELAKLLRARAKLEDEREMALNKALHAAVVRAGL